MSHNLKDNWVNHSMVKRRLQLLLLLLFLYLLPPSLLWFTLVVRHAIGIPRPNMPWAYEFWWNDELAMHGSKWPWTCVLNKFMRLMSIWWIWPATLWSREVVLTIWSISVRWWTQQSHWNSIMIDHMQAQSSTILKFWSQWTSSLNQYCYHWWHFVLRVVCTEREHLMLSCSVLRAQHWADCMDLSGPLEIKLKHCHLNDAVF